MKTHHLLRHAALCLVLPCAAFGQASFGFRTYVPNFGVDVHVFDADGQMLVGTNYLAELWGGVTSNSLSPLLTASGNRREIRAFSGSGYIVSSLSSLSVTIVPPNGWAWIEMRAWDARFGETYEEVVSHGLGGHGESPLFYAQGRDPFREPPESPAPLIGLQSFSLRAVVPEPSTWALLALGGIGLWWWPLRRKRRCGP